MCENKHVHEYSDTQDGVFSWYTASAHTLEVDKFLVANVHLHRKLDVGQRIQKHTPELKNISFTTLQVQMYPKCQ